MPSPEPGSLGRAACLGSVLLVLVAIVAILRLVVRRDYVRLGRLTPLSAAAYLRYCKQVPRYLGILSKNRNAATWYRIKRVS